MHTAAALLPIVDLPLCRSRGVDPSVCAGWLLAEGVPQVVLRGRQEPARTLLAVLDTLVQGGMHAGRVLLAGPASLHADPAGLPAGLGGLVLADGWVDDRGLARLRAQLSGGARVGCSAHAATLDAAPGGADFLLLGPWAATATKPGWGPPLGEAGVAAALALPGLPPIRVVGGVAPADVPVLRRLGVQGVAVMGPLCHAAPGALLATWMSHLTEPR
jgi:thiamine-phosphate pyrophosphorylase